MNLKSVVGLSDGFTLFLAVPNLIAVFLLSGIIMKELKIKDETYNDFMMLKKIIEQNSWEKVTEDEVLDFMIRAITDSIELEDEDEHDHHHCHGDHCCWHCKHD